MTPNEIIKDLLETIDGAVVDFNKSMPGIQDEILSSILELSKELVMPANAVKQQVANLRIIGTIKQKINDLILSPEYIDNVTAFAKEFDAVTLLQNKYFNAITNEFSTSQLLSQIKKSYVDYTVESLTEAGIDTISSNVKEILLRSVTSGGSYASMVKDMTKYLTDKEGALVKYTRQITTDALNQYSASYTRAVTDDLGLKWFRYVGSNIKTSRPFCVALTAKDYVYAKELPEIARGVIDGREVSLAGLIPGTSAGNIQVNRGGYNCGHQLYPVAESSVPRDVREATYLRFGIKYDEDVFAIAA